MSSVKEYTSKDIKHIKGKIDYLQFSKLNSFSDKLFHAITLRHGGFSQFPCDSLNFRIFDIDEKINVMKNLRLTCKELGIKSEDVYKGKQNHTDNILIIDDRNKNNYKFENVSQEQIDGYICNTPNIATLVTTADCNPIIIYDKIKNVYANVHSGWKGTIKQIYLKAAKMMHEKYCCSFEDMIVCIGPSIKSCCFSSQESDFKQKFTQIWKNEEEYITYEKDKKTFHIDLGYVIQKDLLNLGIKKENIIISNICTKCNNEDFFSYRDSTTKKHENYGTFATIVMLK